MILVCMKTVGFSLYKIFNIDNIDLEKNIFSNHWNVMFFSEEIISSY